jgi:hypothetical protein
LIIRHFELALDEYVGSVESRLVVSGDLEFTDNVQTTDGNLGSKIVLRKGMRIEGNEQIRREMEEGEE